MNRSDEFDGSRLESLDNTFKFGKYRSISTGKIVHGTGRYQSCCGWTEAHPEERGAWTVGVLPDDAFDVVYSKAEAKDYLLRTHNDLIKSGEHDRVLKDHQSYLETQRRLAAEMGYEI